MSDEPEIVSRSLADARRELPEIERKIGIVSIGSPDTEPPDGVELDHPLHLRLEFDDVHSETSVFGNRRVRPPQRDHISTLLERSELLLDSELVYCHCAAGISRSTAAAYILECRRRNPGDESEALRRILDDNPFASPNRRMVELADELMERSGEMVSVLDTLTSERPP